MNLFVVSTSLHEMLSGQRRFPDHIGGSICEAVRQIGIDELDDLLSRHETDSTNFDGRIEASLRTLSPALGIRSNAKVNPHTKFNCDLVIESDAALVCLEIEKGYLARFELDILKMQSYAYHGRSALPQKEVFGALIVPVDNIVARHISGNSRESSYDYVSRLLRLVGQIGPMSLTDILVVGYSASEPPEVTRGPRSGEPGESLVHEPSDDLVRDVLRGYALEVLMELRKRLKAVFPDLREKYNRAGRYFGYATGFNRDALYVYVQKRRLVLDLRVPPEHANALAEQGFEVRPRNNFQGKAGWLTGLRVPGGTKRLDVILDLAQEALLSSQ
jgi:hypothetical protein